MNYIKQLFLHIIIKFNKNISFTIQNNNITSIHYYKNKIPYGTHTCYYPNGKVKEKRYYKNGKLHRNDKPAFILYHINGNIEVKMYYKNGQIHNENGPAYIAYNYMKNIIKKESYYINGQLHNENGPANIVYYRFILMEAWWLIGLVWNIITIYMENIFHII